MEKSKLWINAVVTLASNSLTNVICPDCEEGVLSVTDIPFENENPNDGGERYIRCPKCNKIEIVLYRKSLPKSWSPNLR